LISNVSSDIVPVHLPFAASCASRLYSFCALFHEKISKVNRGDTLRMGLKRTMNKQMNIFVISDPICLFTI